MTGKYQAYPEYKNSGVEWLGDVPRHWVVTRLAYVFTKSNAGEVIDKTYWGDGQELLYTCNRTPLLSDYSEFPEEKRTGINDLLLTRNGTPYVHKPKVNSIYSNVVQRISLTDEYDRDYLSYCLSNSAANLKGYGVSIESLNFENWKSLSFGCPSKQEQVRIVRFLDNETAKIDTLIEKQQQLIKLLKEKRQAVISHAVTKGLNPDAPMRDSGVEWLGAVPTHWTVGRYKFCTTRVVVGIAEAATHAYADSGVPIIRSTNIKEEGLDSSDILFIKEEFAEQNESKYLYANDVVTVRTGYPGISAVVPDELNKSQCFTNLIATPTKGCLPDFLAEYLNSHTGKSYFELLGWGSAQKNISVPILQNIPIAWPTEDEQVQIMQFVKEKRAMYFTLIDKAEAQISLLSERRTALISAAVTGKIDVRNWKAPENKDKENAA